MAQESSADFNWSNIMIQDTFGQIWVVIEFEPDEKNEEHKLWNTQKNIYIFCQSFFLFSQQQNYNPWTTFEQKQQFWELNLVVPGWRQMWWAGSIKGGRCWKSPVSGGQLGRVHQILGEELKWERWEMKTLNQSSYWRWIGGSTHFRIARKPALGKWCNISGCTRSCKWC